ncbi:MAG: OsmC family protein [Sphingopyxis sp.]
MNEHHYRLHLDWTGNRGAGTADYRAYGREHRLSARGKPDIAGSSDPAFRGDAGAWNPEELLVASISACHQLWYLHLAAEAGIIVTAYVDDPVGVMTEDADGGGHFTAVTLHPRVTLADAPRRGRCAARACTRAVFHCAVCQFPGGRRAGRVVAQEVSLGSQ